MKRILTIALIACLAGAAGAQDTSATEAAAADAEDGFAPIPAAEADLSEYVWQKRPIVVFADTADDPRFVEQMSLLEARWPELAERQVVVIVDTDPAAETAIRRQLRPRGFQLALIDRDGRVALRKPFPWDVRELGRAIDRMR